ncbi:hypothetical protein [Methylomagnum sp.]
MILPYNQQQTTSPIKESLDTLINGTENGVLLAESRSFSDEKERYEWKTPFEIYDEYHKFFTSKGAEISGYLGQPSSCSDESYVWKIDNKKISLFIDWGDRDLPIYVYLHAT